MKKTSILLTLFCGLLYVSLSSNNSGPATVSMVDCTETTLTSCGKVGCHTGTGSFTFPNVVLWDVAAATTVSSYTPGTSYRIVAGGVPPAGLTKFGFQVKAVNALGTAPAGTMTAPAGTHITPIGSIPICEHSSAMTMIGLADSIGIPWTAPAAGFGSVTVKAAINAVNFNSSTTGDVSTIMSATFTEASAVPPITGTFTVCVGGSTTLANTVTGGSWSSSTPGVATIGLSTGLMTGVAAGTSTISYVSGSGTATKIVTVVPVPTVTVTGSSSVCVAHTITLTGSPAGGTWTSVFPLKATITSAGVVSGVATGVDTIKYKVTNVCGLVDSAKKVLTITPNSTSCGVAVANVTMEQFNIYPNPNRGSFTLDLASPLNGQAYVVVTNATGAKVKDFVVNTNDKIDVTLNQPPGVYFVAATTLTQRYFVKVVVE